VAATLRADFLRAGVDAFLDVESIAVGSVWRQRLNDRLTDANVMIAVVDEITASREWPAAELEAALRRRARAGSPGIVLLVPEEIRLEPSVARLPVFSELLKPHDVFTENEPRVIVMTGATIPVLVGTLRRGYYRSPALLPNTLEAMRRWLTAPFQFLLSRCATHVAALGNVGFLLTVIESQTGSRVRRLIFDAELLGPCTLASAFFAGLTLRFLIAARFEMHPRPSLWSIVWRCCGLVGFISLLTQWGTMLSPLLRGWAIVCLAVGWLWAASFARRARLTSDPYEMN
jgi:hypothetical protein